MSFVGRGRSERVVTQQQVFARQAIADLGDDFHPELPRLSKDRPHEPNESHEPHNSHELEESAVQRTDTGERVERTG